MTGSPEDTQPERWPRWAVGLLVGLLVVLGGMVWAPMLDPNVINHDQDYLRFVISRATAWRSLVDYGQLPLRTHQLGGGVPSFAHPHDPGLHPLLLLTWVFGPLLGSKLEYIACWGLGVFGTWLLTAKALRFAWPAALFATATLAGLSWTSHRVLGGDVPELQYLLTPLFLALLILGRTSVRAVVGAALLLASIAIVGAYRTALIAGFAGLFLLLDGAVRSEGARRAATVRRDLENLGVVGLCGGLLAAPKLLVSLPVVLDSFRWSVKWKQDHQTPATTWELLVSPPTEPGLLHTWSHHVGPLVLLLALVGLIRWRRAVAPVVLGLFAVWMIGGPHWPVDGFALLQKLPVLGAITAAPKQFNFFLMTSLLLLAAGGVDLLWTRWRSHALTASLAVLVVAHTVWLGGISAQLIDWTFDTPLRRLPADQAVTAILNGEVVVPTEGPRPFRTASLDSPRRESDLHVSVSSPAEHPHMLYWVLSGYGEPTWWDTFFPEGPVVPSHRLDERTRENREDPAYRGEVYVLSGTDCVRVTRFTPLRITAEASCPADDWIVVNQNADPGWRASGVPTTTTPEGLLAVPVPAGERTINLRYHLRGFRAGLAVGFVGLVALLGWARVRRERGGIAAAGVADSEEASGVADSEEAPSSPTEAAPSTAP